MWFFFILFPLTSFIHWLPVAVVEVTCVITAYLWGCLGFQLSHHRHCIIYNMNKLQLSPWGNDCYLADDICIWYICVSFKHPVDHETHFTDMVWSRRWKLIILIIMFGEITYPHIIGHVITHPCWVSGWFMLVKELLVFILNSLLIDTSNYKT